MNRAKALIEQDEDEPGKEEFLGLMAPAHVWVGVIAYGAEANHYEVCVRHTEDALLQDIADYCYQNWNVIEWENQNDGLPLRIPVPRPEYTRGHRELIEPYFEYHQGIGDQWLQVWKLKIDKPSTALVWIGVINATRYNCKVIADSSEESLHAKIDAWTRGESGRRGIAHDRQDFDIDTYQFNVYEE